MALINKFIKEISSVVRSDFFAKLIRYGVVGIVVAVIYISLYFLLDKYFSILPELSNLLAFFIAVALQYRLQSKFTFRVKDKSRKRILRFCISVFLGYLFSLFITSYTVPHGYVSELIGLMLVVVLLPILNLILMFVWVFATKN